MSAHLNIATTYGITLPDGAVAEDASRTKSVDVAELVAAATGEYAKATPVNLMKVDVTITGEGPAEIGTVASEATITPATLKVIKRQQTEAPNQRCRFTLSASGHEAFTDVTGTSAAGAEPTIDNLVITSVEYAVCESVDRSKEVQDKVLVGSNGQPAFRGTCMAKGSFTINGRGDIPVGPALGTGGSAMATLGGGLVVVTQLSEGERKADWNRWGTQGSSYPSAAA